MSEGEALKRITKDDITYLTPGEIAEKYRISRGTVTRWLHEGHLEGFKIRNSWRIPEESVFELIKESTGRGR
jgi:excisionase family DNA binding protein